MISRGWDDVLTSVKPLWSADHLLVTSRASVELLHSTEL